MTHEPRRQETIRSDIQDSLEGKIPGLTNFIEGSFNDAWLDAYAEEIRELEAKIVAAQLALWVDYAADDSLNQTDLEATGIDFTGWTDSEISSFITDVNSFMEDVHLDRIGDLVGIDRDSGTKASGKVTITTASDTTQVNEGLEVATEPDSNGDYFSFFVDADGDGDTDGSESTTPASGQTTVDVDIFAEEVGSDYNVGANTITFLPDPDPGIEAVNNAAEVTGGVDEQSNEDYRDELRGSVVSQSGGGTAAGIEGAVEDVDGVVDVELDEFQDEDPPTVDVIVDGGSDSDVTDEIDSSKPTGISHLLVRPENINTGFRLELIGKDIDSTFTQNELEEYIQDLGMDQDFRRVKAVQNVMNADRDIEDIGSLTIFLTSIVDESETFSSGTNIYSLDFDPCLKVEGERRLFQSGTLDYSLGYDNAINDSNVEVTAIVNGDETVLTKDTDYFIRDDSGDGNNDTISFDSSDSGTDDDTAAGTTPDDRTVFEIEYDIDNDEFGSTTVTGTLSGSDHTFTESTDYQIEDASGNVVGGGSASNPAQINWGIGGDSPDDGTDFSMDYDVERVILDDQTTTVREKVSLDGSKVSVSTIDPL